MKSALFTVLLLCFVVGMQSTYAAARWHTGVKIKMVYPLSGGDFVLTFDQDNPSCTSDSSPDYYRVSVGQNGVTAEGADKMYAAALTAASSGKTVNINFDDATSGCYVNRLEVIF